MNEAGDRYAVRVFTEVESREWDGHTEWRSTTRVTTRDKLTDTILKDETLSGQWRSDRDVATADAVGASVLARLVLSRSSVEQ